MKTILAAAAVAATALAGAAHADDLSTVRAFYAHILTAPAETTEARYYELFCNRPVLAAL